MGTRWAERRWSCGTGGDRGDGEKPSVCRSPIKQKARWLGFVCLAIPAPLLGQGKWVAVSGVLMSFPPGREEKEDSRSVPDLLLGRQRGRAFPVCLQLLLLSIVLRLCGGALGRNTLPPIPLSLFHSVSVLLFMCLFKTPSLLDTMTHTHSHALETDTGGSLISRPA